MLDAGGGFSGLPVWSVGAVGPSALCPLLIVAMVSAAKRPKLWNSGVYRAVDLWLAAAVLLRTWFYRTCWK